MRISESRMRRIIRQEAQRVLRESNHPSDLGGFTDLRKDPGLVADKIINDLDGGGEFLRRIIIDAIDGDHSADMQLMGYIQDTLGMSDEEFEAFDPSNKFSDAVIDELSMIVGL